jgi:DNA-binding GntR family transcriptional regulator
MQYCSPVIDLDNAVLSQRVFIELEAKIVDRSYPPGSHLVEDVVAAELGVSRTPVREAFRLLQRAGWLDLRPHAGAYVRYPTVDEVRDVFELRQTLEQRAAELAARRAKASEHRELAKLIERGRRSLARGDLKAIGTINTEFHAKIAESAHNEMLRSILSDLAKHVRWHFSAVAGIRGEASWTEHEAILAAIARGEEARAAALAAEHSQHTQNAFFAQLLEDGTARVS